jgi:hypothetical protein
MKKIIIVLAVVVCVIQSVFVIAALVGAVSRQDYRAEVYMAIYGSTAVPILAASLLCSLLIGASILIRHDNFRNIILLLSIVITSYIAVSMISVVRNIVVDVTR